MLQMIQNEQSNRINIKLESYLIYIENLFVQTKIMIRAKRTYSPPYLQPHPPPYTVFLNAEKIFSI